MPPRPTTSNSVPLTPPEHCVLKLRCALNTMPMEILQQIGLEFHQNRDLQDYALTCKATFSALERDDRHFWRNLFLKCFDSPNWPAESDNRVANVRFKRRYMFRQRVLSGTTIAGFCSGFRKNEVEALELLRDMVIEASFDQSCAVDGVTSKNLLAIISFVRRLNCFRLFYVDEAELDVKAYTADGKHIWNPMLLMIQCICAPMTLKKERQRDEVRSMSKMLGKRKRSGEVLGFPVSQSIVYASAIARPLFSRAVVNFETTLHHLNFWKYHFLYDRTGAVTPWYAELPDHERPSFWTSKLSGNDLGIEQAWKGTYAYLDDPDYFMYGPDGTTVNGQQKEEILQDEFLGEGVNCPFQDLELRLCDLNEHYWPEIFSFHIPRTSGHVRARTRAQGRSFQESSDQTEPVPFIGKGLDQGEQFFLSGWLEQMPSQMKVPGWRRLIMMKYYISEDTNVVDDDALWAYEGVVFPGGRIIVGRWWYPSSDRSLRHAYRGPFILWTVRSSGAA